MTRLFVNNLTSIDSSLLDPDRGIVGESWKVDVELEGSLNQQGMVLDFADIKKQVKQTIDWHFDHKLLVPAASENCVISETPGVTNIEFQLNSGSRIVHSSPGSAVTLLNSKQVNTETLTAAALEILQPEMPDNVHEFHLRLHHEKTSDPIFHYSHGLKQHLGNCQRIAHGHRSRIEIYRNGERDSNLETEWAELWRAIYIGTRSDLVKQLKHQEADYYLFSYRAQHGDFSIELPRELCYLVDSESTIENLAQHIADTLKQKNTDDEFQVRVFEGVDKGAIGTA